MSVRTVKQLVVLALIAAPLDLAGQELSNPLLGVGQLRVGISSRFDFADQRFGQRMEGGSLVEEVEALGFDFEDTNVGSRLFPTLEDMESDLATAAGATITPLDLGRTRAVLTRDAVWLPLRLDVGVLDWLTVGATVPFSRRRAEFETTIQTEAANVGIIPGTAGDFTAAVSTANTALSGIVGTLCTANPSSPECVQATSLLAEGQAFHDTVRRAYDDYGVFPLEGSTNGDALQSRTTSLEAAYQTAGVSSFPTLIPLATDGLTEAAYLDLASSPSFRVQGEVLETWRSPWELGDVEIHASARLWRMGQDTPPDEPQPSIRMEVGGGALFRIGTGRTDSPRNFLDTGSGDGQHDIELSGFGALGVGGFLDVLGEFRYGIQRPVNVLRRITAPDRIFAPLDATEQEVRWNPGDYMQFRVSPRVHLAGQVALAFDVLYFKKKADAYALVGGSTGPDPAVLELETKGHIMSLGGGLIFSTVRRGNGRPLEAQFLVQQAVSGSGGTTPKTWRVNVGLKLYWSLWGGG